MHPKLYTIFHPSLEHREEVQLNWLYTVSTNLPAHSDWFCSELLLKRLRALWHKIRIPFWLVNEVDLMINPSPWREFLLCTVHNVIVFIIPLLLKSRNIFLWEPWRHCSLFLLALSWDVRILVYSLARLSLSILFVKGHQTNFGFVWYSEPCHRLYSSS